MADEQSDEFETVSVGSVASLEVRDPSARPPFYRRHFLPMVLGMLLVAIVLGILSLWSRREEGFPELPAGSYAGTMTGIFADEGGGAVSWYVESAPHDGGVFVAMLRKGWEPQNLRISGEGLVEEARPMILTGEEGTLQLTGRAVSGGVFRGEVVDHVHQSHGEWTLRPVHDIGTAVTRQTGEGGVRLWLTLRAELRGIEAKRNFTEQEEARQRAEITRLTAFVTDDTLVRSQADQRFDEARKAFDAVKSQLQAARADVGELARQFALSQRLAGTGKLVSLARDSIERESRWVRSMLRTGGSEPPEVVAERDRAARVFEVKAEIAKEEARLQELRSASGSPAESGRSFDDLFRQGGSQ